MAEEELPQDSKLELAETLFLLSIPDTPDIERQKHKEEVLAAVEKDGASRLVFVSLFCLMELETA